MTDYDRQSVPRGAGPASIAKLYPDHHRSFRRGGLVFHVHDLDAAGHFRRRVGGVLELGLAVSDGYELGAGDAEFVDQITLDRVGSAPRKGLVVGRAAP